MPRRASWVRWNLTPACSQRFSTPRLWYIPKCVFKIALRLFCIGFDGVFVMQKLVLFIILLIKFIFGLSFRVIYNSSSQSSVRIRSIRICSQITKSWSWLGFTLSPFCQFIVVSSRQLNKAFHFSRWATTALNRGKKQGWATAKKQIKYRPFACPYFFIPVWAKFAKWWKRNVIDPACEKGAVSKSEHQLVPRDNIEGCGATNWQATYK